jgi:hypothetical protein
VASRFAVKLASLGFKLPWWCKAPSELLVREYEERFGLTLPDDYREFLVHHGGVVGCAVCAYQEPTPGGHATCLEAFYGFGWGKRHVARATELLDCAPEVVAVGENLVGMFWLKCSGWDRGHVYIDDTLGRCAWPDEMFYERCPNLSPTIKDYLEMRKRGELPKKRPGYEHVYRLATSFEEFVERLEQCKME